MEFKDLVTVYFERSTAMQTFWNFYLTVILGLLAFFGVMKPSAKSKNIALLMSVAFALFAAVNLNGLLGVTTQRRVSADLVYSAPVDARYRPLQSAINENPPPIGWVLAVHLFGDVATIAAIWFLALRSAEPAKR